MIPKNFSHRVITLDDCKYSHNSEWYKKYIGVHGMLETMRRCLIDHRIEGVPKDGKLSKKDLFFLASHMSWFPTLYRAAKYNEGSADRVVKMFQIFTTHYRFAKQSNYIYDAAFPNRKVPFHKKYRTEHVKGLAWTIYGGERFDLMPILADALEEAGLDYIPLLNHLRTGECFTRASWVLARITQTERY